ncbi:MAG: serine hydrolase [Armatimonadetes bacterium]|nr:serine hydrolase [Armatimonadota bacterium]
MRNFNYKIRKRIIFLFYFCVILFLLLFFRLMEIQAVHAYKFKILALKQHLGTIELPAIRGNIFDCHGEPLAKSLELPSIAVNPKEIKDTLKAAKILSLILSENEKNILNKITSQTTFVFIKRKVDYNLAKQIERLNLEGVFLIKESTGKRFYPKGNLASHLIGCTGIDDQGLDGIEGYYDQSLRGTQGKVETEIDNLGIAIPGSFLKISPSLAGNNLVLTIDEEIQYLAERELKSAISLYHAKRGNVIVMDINNGEILALANYPNFYNENYFFTPKENLRNSAISDAFEPGSIFKVFLASAALDSGKVSLDDFFYCGNSINVGGWNIHNANDGLTSAAGKENLANIITYSFNVGTTSVALKIGKETFYKYIKAFGFGDHTGIDLPGETTGSIIPLEEWALSNLATCSFGQGIAVTPVQLIAAISAIANGGKLYRPHIVKAIISPNGETVKEFKPQLIRQVISFKTSLEMAEILKQVVEKGTGKKAQIPGYLVAGKTGTAQKCDRGVYVNNYIASFLGFFPVDEPRFAILVKIEEPQGIIWGGYVAAPVFKSIAQELLWHYGIPPSLPINNLRGKS